MKLKLHNNFLFNIFFYSLNLKAKKKTNRKKVKKNSRVEKRD